MTRWVGERAGVVGGREQDARDGAELARVMGWVSEWQRRVWLDRGRDRAMARYFIGRWAQTRERAMTYFGSHLTNLCNWHIALPHRQSRVLTSPAPRGGHKRPKTIFAWRTGIGVLAEFACTSLIGHRPTTYPRFAHRRKLADKTVGVAPVPLANHATLHKLWCDFDRQTAIARAFRQTVSSLCGPCPVLCIRPHLHVCAQALI